MVWRVWVQQFRDDLHGREQVHRQEPLHLVQGHQVQGAVERDARAIDDDVQRPLGHPGEHRRDRRAIGEVAKRGLDGNPLRAGFPRDGVKSGFVAIR